MAQLKPWNLYSVNSTTPGRSPLNGQNRLLDDETGFTYRYVKCTIGGSNANTLEAGRPVYYDSFAAGTVKTDQGGTDELFAGVLLGPVTSGNYCWIQSSGQAWAILTNALTNQSNLIADPTNGRLKVVSAATDIVLGQNYAAGNLPTPAAASGAIFSPTLNTAGGVTGLNVLANGATYGTSQTYTLIFIDPTGRGTGAAGTVECTAGGTFANSGTFAVSISAAGSNYSAQTIVLIGVTQVMLRAPLG